MGAPERFGVRPGRPAVVEGFLLPRHMGIGRPIESRLGGECQKRYRVNLDTRLDKL